MSARAWYRMQPAPDEPAVVDVHIFDLIGSWLDDVWGLGGVTAKRFVEQLQALPAAVRTIRLHLNSPGGDVYGGLAIANALREQRLGRARRVEVVVEGLAASAATLPMMAGNPIRIAENAQIFVHNPWTVVTGDAGALRQAAADLDKTRAAIVATYQWHSPQTEAELGALMDAATLLTADEALAAGFATEKVVGLQAVAALDRRALGRFPEAVRARLAPLVRVETGDGGAAAPAAEEPVEPDEDGQCPEGYALGEDGLCHLLPPEDRTPADPKAVVRACREAGVPELAEALLGQPMAAVRRRVARETAARAAATRRATEIRTLCQAARLPDVAEILIRGALPVAEVRALLTTLTARLDAVEIDRALPPDRGAPAAPRINTFQVYQQLNAKRGG